MTKMIQWATGSVGSEMLRVILQRGDFQLVGVHAWSEDKVGVDAGALAGLGMTTGVIATNDVDELLAAGAECVMYTPYMPDIDVLVRFLEAGVNVVTTANFLRGSYLDRFGMQDAPERLDAAAKKGGASIYAGGYNPGFVTQLPLVLTSLSSTVDLIEIEESGDIGHYESTFFFEILGWGKPLPAVDRPQRSEAAAMMDGFLFDGLDMIAEACKFNVTERIAHVEYAITPTDLVCPAMTFPAGTIAGQRTRWEYLSGDQVVIRMTITWFLGDQLEPNLGKDMDGGIHHYTIHGEPTIDVTTRLRPPADGNQTVRMRDGMVATGMNALNAAPYVCAAAAGFRSYLDMPPTPGIAAHNVRARGD